MNGQFDRADVHIELRRFIGPVEGKDGRLIRIIPGVDIEIVALPKLSPLPLSQRGTVFSDLCRLPDPFEKILFVFKGVESIAY